MNRNALAVLFSSAVLVSIVSFAQDRPANSVSLDAKLLSLKDGKTMSLSGRHIAFSFEQLGDGRTDSTAPTLPSLFTPKLLPNSMLVVKSVEELNGPFEP